MVQKHIIGFKFYNALTESPLNKIGAIHFGVLGEKLILLITPTYSQEVYRVTI